MKMGIIAPRAGIKPTSLAGRVSVLTITLPKLPDVTILSTSSCLCGLVEYKTKTILTVNMDYAANTI